MKVINCFLIAMACAQAGAATWYADAARPDDAGDGRTAATAKKHIQSAVALANADADAEVTVLVAPGTYDGGGYVTDSKGGRDRVLITRSMTLRSTGNKDNTFIVGAFGSASYGLGTDSIRAVCVESGAGGTVIQGFTFRDSAAGSNNGTPSGGGGGVCYIGNDCSVFVKDCTASNCAAYYGGGFRGVTAIRSLVIRCHTNNSNSGSALDSCKAYNCIFAHCGSDLSWAETVLRGDGPYVNCTAVANNGSLLRYSANQKIYNTLSTLCSRQEFDGTNKGGPNCIQQEGNGRDSASKTVSASPASAYVTLLVSPLTGDYRPVATSSGGSAEGYGSTEWLAEEHLGFVPADERDTDYFGNPRVVNGQVDCGAIQGAVAISGGRIIVPQQIPTTGSAFYTRYLYANAETWPAQVYLAQPEGTFASVILTNNVASYFRFADVADGIWQTLPRSGPITVTNIPATTTLYVDAAASAGGNGTAATPFQTIQAAVDAAPANGYTLIDVADGVYSNGTRVAEGTQGQAARVVIDGDKHVFVRAATNGGVVIQGVKDPDSLETDHQGCGPNAVRCVVVSPGHAMIGIRGVVMQGGASGVGPTSGTYGELENIAGGLWVMGAEDDMNRSSDVQVMDSTFSGNVGRKGSAALGGWLQRCRVFNNINPESIGISCLNRTILSSCVIYENRRRGDQLMANGARLYNCTVYGTYLESNQDLLAVSACAYGSVFIRGKLNKSASQFVENIVWNLSTNCMTSGFTEVDPLMANVRLGNFAPRAGSPAFGAVDANNIGNFWRYHVGDLNGNPINVSTEGKITAGAVQNAYVPVAAYVDANGGNDANDGLTAESAKRTLAAALALASVPGDTVTAAAGTYDEGTALQPSALISGTPSVPARGFVWPGVSLVGAGATNTTVKGGENVRGLAVGAGARISGFTIADGLVVTNSSSQTDDTVGGGVLAADDPSTTFTDCVFTNNAASFGGAARGGTYSRCAFYGNLSYCDGLGTSSSAATMMDATLRNCLFSGNKAARMIVNYDGVYNCTFLYDNTRVSGNRISSFGTYRGTAAVVNSAFLIAPTDNTSANLALAIYAATNCFIPKINGTSWNWQLPPERCSGNLTNDVAWGAASLTDATAWARRRAITVDAGATAYASADDTDLAGNPRISNGVVDIGCYEWQWEPPNGTTVIFR